MTRDQYIVRLVHTNIVTGWIAHTAYHGPYPAAVDAMHAADRLDGLYRDRPMKVDGAMCKTRCYVEILMPPIKREGDPPPLSETWPRKPGEDVL